MRVLVCGGRHFKDRELVFKVLDDAGISFLIHGARKIVKANKCHLVQGVDDTASCWASMRGVPQENFPALWHVHGNAAGPIRNQEMLDKGRPRMVLAFPGGAGTSDMKGRARKAGLRVREVKV